MGGVSTCLSLVFCSINHDCSQALLANFNIDVVYFSQLAKSIQFQFNSSCDSPKRLTKFLSPAFFCNDLGEKYVSV